jgi:glycosyltransferase involved in cell wall biosynthesis
VLLVTDRPFLEPIDGSTHTYLMWLRVLTDLGCQVSVLSFDRESLQWSPKDLGRLPSLTASSLILKAHGNRLGTMVDTVLSTVWRSLAGRRYLPAPLETVLRRGQRDRLVAFLQEGQFDSIMLNKLHTTALIGRNLFRSLPARKVIDIHDNYPVREALNRQILLDLARSDWPAFRAAIKPRDLLEMASWAKRHRLLAEEVRRLSDFDHVVFNAREEAELYVRTGLPRAKVAVLPLPRPQDQADIKAADHPRPYQIGLIASAALSNIEGLHFLANRIMPTLRQHGIRLLVAGTIGRYAKPLVPPESGTVLGWIDDVATFYDQVEVILVPLLTGTGVSVKAMEAAAHGAAIVTTTIGMRGLDLQPGQDLLVADDPEAFIAAVLRVLDDSALKLQLRRNAQLALRRHHSRDAFARGVAALLQTTPVAARTTLTASGANPQ